MSLRGFAWLKRLMPMSRRDQARLAQLDHTRAGMAIIADMLRGVAARHDAHAHLIGKAARSSRGGLTETTILSLGRDLMMTHAAGSMARSKQTAGDLDTGVRSQESLHFIIWNSSVLSNAFLLGKICIMDTVLRHRSLKSVGADASAEMQSG